MKIMKVSITGGKWDGHRGTIIRPTPKMFWVKLDTEGSPPDEEVLIAKTCVQTEPAVAKSSTPNKENTAPFGTPRHPSILSRDPKYSGATPKKASGHSKPVLDLMKDVSFCETMGTPPERTPSTKKLLSRSKSRRESQGISRPPSSRSPKRFASILPATGIRKRPNSNQWWEVDLQWLEVDLFDYVMLLLFMTMLYYPAPGP
jgi:hypothetical protein